MKTLEALLRASIAIYTDLLQRMQAMTEELCAASPERLQALVEEMNWRQQELRGQDAALQNVLQEAGEGAKDHPLLCQRQELMQQVAAQNRLISEKIRGMMSVISAEIGQLRGGMTAMSGYHGGRDQKGSVLQKSC
ncbi:MAG: hypothetical protein AB7F21_12115 [Desulfuromonadales bacterium]